MGVNIDVNKGIENKETRSFFKFVFGVIVFIIIVAGGILVFLNNNGKHIKLPGGIEMNIPVYKSDSLKIKKDTIVVNNNQKNYNIDNKGTINIDSNK